MIGWLSDQIEHLGMKYVIERQETVRNYGMKGLDGRCLLVRTTRNESVNGPTKIKACMRV